MNVKLDGDRLLPIIALMIQGIREEQYMELSYLAEPIKTRKPSIIAMTQAPALTPETKLTLYNHLIKSFSRLTVKILLGFNPDGLDRMTILLGRGTDYEYRLLRNPQFREHELNRYLDEVKMTRN